MDFGLTRSVCPPKPWPRIEHLCGRHLRESQALCGMRQEDRPFAATSSESLHDLIFNEEG